MIDESALVSTLPWEAFLDHCEPFIRRDAQRFANERLVGMDFDTMCQVGRYHLYELWQGCRGQWASGQKPTTLTVGRIIKRWRDGIQNKYRDLYDKAHALCRDPAREVHPDHFKVASSGDGEVDGWSRVTTKGAQDTVVSSLVITETLSRIRKRCTPVQRAVLSVLLDPTDAVRYTYEDNDSGHTASERGPSPSFTVQELAETTGLAPKQVERALRVVRQELEEALLRR